MAVNRTGYGLDKAGTLNSPTTSGNLTGGAATQYVFETIQRRVWLTATDTCPNPIYFKFNSATCDPATGDYDTVRQPGDAFPEVDGPGYSSVCAYSAANATFGSHFNIRGANT